MQILFEQDPGLLEAADTAISETAATLRRSVRQAIDPPHTSRQVRRSHLKQELFRQAVEFASSAEEAVLDRMFASARWGVAFIDSALADVPEPEVAVDEDGDILFEWLSNPSEVVTVTVGPTGDIHFASLAGSSRIRGVTKVGDQASLPFRSCMASIRAH